MASFSEKPGHQRHVGLIEHDSIHPRQNPLCGVSRTIRR